MVNREQIFLSTGCESLDKMLGGGIRTKEITLVYGEPDTGKTSLAIQCAYKCTEKGLKTIFIDSDNTFSLNRLEQIAGNNLNEVSPLIFIFKPRNFKEQTLIIESLDSYNLSHIALIVVDAITNLYRIELELAGRIFALNMTLNWQIAYLNELASTYNPPVLLTSQVRSMVQGNLGEKKIEPIANRVLKFWAQKIINLEATSDTEIIEATLEKGFTGNKNKCFYMLNKKGVVSF